MPFIHHASTGGLQGCTGHGRGQVSPRGPGRPFVTGGVGACQRRPPGLGRLSHGVLAAAAAGGRGVASDGSVTAGDAAARVADAGEQAGAVTRVQQRDGGKAGAPAAAAGGPSSPGPAGPSAGPAVGSQPGSTDRDMSLEPFRSLVEGRRFHCTMCGKCCTGEGEIWVSPDEASRIARHLHMPAQRFLDSHTKQYSKYRGWRMLRTKEGSSSCTFLGPDNKCSIHPVRPSQCSTYPWWPELMVDREWEWEKANVCEGFDHPEAGPLDAEEAATQLREANKMTQLRLLASTVRVTSKVSDWANAVLVWDDELEAQAKADAGQRPGGQGQVARGQPGAKSKRKND